MGPGGKLKWLGGVSGVSRVEGGLWRVCVCVGGGGGGGEYMRWGGSVQY